MFHLFDRKYVSLDALGLYNLPGEQRLYITDASFSVPLVSDANFQTVCGILGYYQNLNEVDNAYIDRNVFWKSILEDKRSISIVASPAVAAELMIQFWKSIFVNHTVDSLYLLYKLYTNHDNAQAYSERLKSYNTADGTKMSKMVIPRITKEAFASLYETVRPVELLSELSSEQISFEYQLISYMAGTRRPDIRATFFKKLDRFVSKFLAQSLIDGASELIECSSTLDLHDGYADDGEICPLCMLDQIPQYKWIFSKSIYERDADMVLREFGLGKIAKIMQDLDEYRKEKVYENEVKMLFLLSGKQYAEMVEFDISLGATSFFARKSNRTKVNPLLIDFLYRLHRQGRADELKIYELK